MSTQKTPSEQCEVKVNGMHCDSCELYIENVVRKQPGVKSVKANSVTQMLRIEYNEDVDSESVNTQINEIIKKRGYSLDESLLSHSVTVNRYKLVSAFFIAAALVGLFLYAQKLNVASFYSAEKMTYLTAFILGIVASLTSCMAVVGGLVLSFSASLEKKHQHNGVIAFHIARIVGFMILGGVIGSLGKMVVVNGLVANVLEIIISIMMIIIGLDMFGIKLPKIVLPKFISEYFDIFSDKEGITGAVFLGVSTFFLPCAFTQSMQLYAMSTGNVISGALTMGAFALGTFPALAMLSIGSVFSYEKFKQSIAHNITAFIMIMLALFNILNVIR